MVKENFVQIPNKMFTDTNNDEKLVYVKLLQSQMVGYLDKDNRTTMTTVITLVTLLGWAEGTRSNKRVETALNGLKSKDYINFDSTKKVFGVGINKWDDKEKHELKVDWKESNVNFSGHTQIKYSVIDNLLENKDFTLYAYAEYRTMKTHQYKICYEEWGMVLGMTGRNAFDTVNDSEVIVKVSHGYNKNTKKRETNSYLTFDKADHSKETYRKPFYKARVEKEKVVELAVIDNKMNDAADIEQQESVTELPAAFHKMFGTDVHSRILKLVEDSAVTTVEQIKELTDFEYPMSVWAYNLLGITADEYLQDLGKKKLQNKFWQKKFGEKLISELREFKQQERIKKMSRNEREKMLREKESQEQYNDTRYEATIESINRKRKYKKNDRDISAFL